MIDHSDNPSSLFDYCNLLVDQGLYDPERWRAFHCRCCRSAWRYLTNDAKKAVLCAEFDILNGSRSLPTAFMHEMMTRKSERAWSHALSLVSPSEDPGWLWPISDEVDGVFRSYFSAQCASIATKNVIGAFEQPDNVTALITWSLYRKDPRYRSERSEDREILERWIRINDEQEKNQILMLREFFGLSDSL
jgi:hypothetical protein